MQTEEQVFFALSHETTSLGRVQVLEEEQRCQTFDQMQRNEERVGQALAVLHGGAGSVDKGGIEKDGGRSADFEEEDIECSDKLHKTAKMEMRWISPKYRDICRWLFLFLLLGQNWLCVNAAAEGVQRRTEMMERMPQ